MVARVVVLDVLSIYSRMKTPYSKLLTRRFRAIDRDLSGRFTFITAFELSRLHPGFIPDEERRNVVRAFEKDKKQLTIWRILCTRWRASDRGAI